MNSQPTALTPAEHRGRAALIGLLAFTLHAVFVVWIAPHISHFRDQQVYDQGYGIAQNLVAGRGYLEVWHGLEFKAWRPPVFPLLLAANIVLFGSAMLPVKLMLGLFGALTAVGVYYLARRLFGDRVALLAGIAAAVNPSAIFSSGWPEPSNLIAALLVANFLALLRARDGGLRDALVAGLVLGATVLAKTFYLTFPFIVAVWLLIQPGARAPKLRKIAVIWATVAVMMTPWIIRNSRVLGEPRITTTDAGFVLWVANSRQWLTADWEKMDLPPPEYHQRWNEFAHLPEIERNAWFVKDALKTIRSLPGAYAKRVVERTWLLWKPFPYVKKWRVVDAAKTVTMAVSYLPILVFFLISVYLLRRDWRTFSLTYAQIVTLTASLALVHGVSRYRVSLEPLMLVQAAYAFDRLVLARRRARVALNILS